MRIGLPQIDAPLPARSSRGEGDRSIPSSAKMFKSSGSFQNKFFSSIFGMFFTSPEKNACEKFHD
jgi:hypothetical protein